MADDEETPRQAAARFRRIISQIDDKRTVEAVSKLIAELEAKADAQEQTAKLKVGRTTLDIPER